MAQTIGYKGEELDFLIRQGGTFGPYTLRLKNPDGSPINISGVTFQGHVRKTPNDLTTAAQLVFTTLDAVQGVAQFEIPANQTSSLVAGDNEDLPESQYVYDIEYLTEDLRVIPLMYGKVKVFREVTK